MSGMSAARWKRVVRKADKRAEDRRAAGPHAALEDIYESDFDEEAHPEAVAHWTSELPRPTSTRKLAQESWSLLACTAKNRVLRDAAALPPPDGSGGPFYALPHEMFTQILSGSVVSLKDYAHILRTCLLFNSAAVSKSVFAAVGKAAVSEARQEAEAADAAAQEARNKIAEAGERVDTHDMEPGTLKLAHQTASTTRSGVYDAPGTWSAGTYNMHGCEDGLCVIQYEDGTIYHGRMRNGERHGLGVELFTDSGRECRFEGSWDKDKRNALGVLLNGDFFDGMLGSYKWGEPWGMHLCWGVREGAASSQREPAPAGEDVQFVFYGPEPKGKKPKAGADGYMRR